MSPPVKPPICAIDENLNKQEAKRRKREEEESENEFDKWVQDEFGEDH